MKKYDIESTSDKTADVQASVLGESPGGRTRNVAQGTLVKNANEPKAAVKVTLLHQRKKKDDAWADDSSAAFNTLKAGESAKFALSTEETLELYKDLVAWYAIYDEKKIPWGKEEVVVGFPHELLNISGDRAKVLKGLVDNKAYTEEFWKLVRDNAPELATKLGKARLQEEREKALVEFKKGIDELRGERDFWDRFFQDNKWIFGYGLNYQFLGDVEGQPNYGGADVSGKGTQRGDTLLASAGKARFTVLVEIKAPGTALLDAKSYRNGAYAPSKELAGAIAQVQVNANQWEVEGSRTDKNREKLEEEGVYTVAPRSIVVIGLTSDLDERDKRRSFELLRRTLKAPEVITFDELYERAAFIVGEGKDSS